MAMDDLAGNSTAGAGTSQAPSAASDNVGSSEQASGPESADMVAASSLHGQANSVESSQVGRDLNLENSIFNGDVYYQITQSQRRSTVRQFSLADATEVTEAEERRTVEQFAGSLEDAEALTRHLEERRVLVLSAEAGARKVTSAKYAALLLRRKGACGRSALLVESVDRNATVNVRRMPLTHSELKDRVVIFRYPLARGNPDIADTFAKTDRAGWGHLADALRECNAFMVFTATPAEVETFRGVPAFQAVQRTLPAHRDEIRRTRLHEHLEMLRESSEVDPETLQTLSGAAALLVERFRFAPQLVDFADFFVGLGQAAMPVDQALSLFQDGSKRLLHDMDDDLDGWAFGFTLALAQCAPDAAGVPWMDFDRLRRHLLRWLRRDLNVSAGPRDGDEGEPTDVRLELSDASLLTRSRATIEKDPATLADVVRFTDGCPPAALWRILLERHRRVLSAILPRLRELAERPGDDGGTLGVLAAQIVGRIGEIDPERVVVPAAERWAAAANRRHHALVGAMFEGVLGSDDARYRARCFEHLRAMYADTSTPRGGSRAAAAVVACSWVGYHEFGLAMGELAAVTRAHLVPMIEDAARITKLAERVQRDAQDEKGRAARAARAVHGALQDLLSRIYESRGPVLLGVQAGLASLCAAHGVTPVLREMDAWMSEAGPSMGVLLSLLFLHEGGIATQLGTQRVVVPGEEGAPAAECGQFVFALSNGDSSVRQAVRFFGDLHQRVMEPWVAAELMRREFRDRLKALLVEWVREAAPIPALARPMRAFVEHLAATHDRSLRSIVLQALRTEAVLRDETLRAFATTLRV